MYFAQVTLPELTPIFALFAGMLVAFYGFMKAQSNQYAKTMDALTKERECAAEQASIERRALVTSGVADRENERAERQKMIDVFERVAEATERAADEAKQRNGHLAELSLKSQEMFKQLADRNFEAITHIQKQVVENMTVKHEHIESKE